MSEPEATASRMRGQCLCGAVRFEVDVPERTYSVRLGQQPERV